VLGIASLSCLSYLKVPNTWPHIVRLSDPSSFNQDTQVNNQFIIEGRLVPPQNTYVRLFRLQPYGFGPLTFRWPDLVQTERSSDSGEFKFLAVDAGKYWLIPLNHSLLNPVVPITTADHIPAYLRIEDPFDKLVKKL
jgi:hypothetical protein